MAKNCCQKKQGIIKIGTKITSEIVDKMVFPLAAVREDGCHTIIGLVTETPKSLRAASSITSKQSSNEERDTDHKQRELYQ